MSTIGFCEAYCLFIKLYHRLVGPFFSDFLALPRPAKAMASCAQFAIMLLAPAFLIDNGFDFYIVYAATCSGLRVVQILFNVALSKKSSRCSCISNYFAMAIFLGVIGVTHWMALGMQDDFDIEQIDDWALVFMMIVGTEIIVWDTIIMPLICVSMMKCMLSFRNLFSPAFRKRN